MAFSSALRASNALAGARALAGANAMSWAVARPALALGLLVLFAAGAGAQQPGDAKFEDSPVTTALRKMLEAGWGKGTTAFQEAEKNYLMARNLAPAEARISYAWALVQLKQRKYREAFGTLQDVLDREPGHTGARQARIWVSMLQKEYGQALAEIEAWGADLVKLPLAERDEALASVGRALGFLRGPANGSVTDANLSRTEQALLEKLSNTSADALAAAENGVLQRFAQLTGQLEKTQETAKQKGEEQQFLKQQQIVKDRENVSQDQAALAEQANKLESQANQQLSAVDQQLAPLEQEFARLNALAQPLRNQLVALANDAARIRSFLDTEDDDFRRQQLLRELDFVQQRRFQVDREYGLLDAQAARVNAERNRLLQQRASLVQSYQTEANRLGIQARQLQGQEKKLANVERLNNRPVTGATAASPAMRQQARAWTTYDEFPLDRERLRLLSGGTAPKSDVENP